jgi:GGDEF domain-containing protein
MASVNLTCTSCTAADPCERCRSISRALRSAGHAITQSSRYDALRAATVGTYGFDACVLTVTRHERSIVDAAGALLGRARVALVVEPGALAQTTIPKGFAVIEVNDWQRQPFPIDWISAAIVAQPDLEETRSFEEITVPPADIDSARRRLKLVAQRAQRDLGAAGFPQEARLDLLATLEDEVAWAKMSGGCFGLVLVHFAKKDAHRSSAAGTDELLAFFRRHIEPVVRASDVIAQGSDSLLVLVAEAAPDQTDVAASRIKKALRRALKEAERDKALTAALGRVTLGEAVYPSHGTTRAALLARATAAATTVAR